MSNYLNHYTNPYVGTGNSNGAQGAQGNQGAAGSQGTQGAQGSQGATGAGTQGFQGLQGAQGNQGSQGATGGAQGSQGAQGSAGAQGSIGVQGAQGFQGSVGLQGATGLQGSQGAAGAQGNQGSQGATGTGQILAGGNVTSTTTFTLTTALTACDATNWTTPFTFPPSGRVLFRFSFALQGSGLSTAAAKGNLGLLDHTSHAQVGLIEREFEIDLSVTETSIRVAYEQFITGSANASVQYDIAAQDTDTTTQLIARGDAGAVWGPMVWAVMSA